MKCQILFSGKKKKKKITNLLSAELAKRVVKVKALSKFVADNILKLILLLIKMSSAAVVINALRINHGWPHLIMHVSVDYASEYISIII